MIVSIVANGEEAIEWIRKEGEPDIILMDLNMPVMDGYEAASFIRHQLHLIVPIIAMTATSFREEKDRCMESGMNDYLSKPVEFDDLYKRMARLIADRPFDLSMLEELNDKGMLLEVIDMFLRNTPEMIDELVIESGKQNWKKTYALAHQLKGSLGVFKANNLVNLTIKIEEQANSHRNSAIVQALMNDLRAAFAGLEPKLRDYADRLKGNK